MSTAIICNAQIAAWDFTGVGSTSIASMAATIFDPNLITTSSANFITRGSNAAWSTGSNSWRTTGFQNNGISTSNTDYFQITLTSSSNYKVSLSTIDAKVAGTASFCASPGVSQQFAYSLDGSNFTLISTPQVTIGSPGTLTQINLASIPSLQNVPSGTTITIRYYASGQTTTGGWGFNSPSAGQYGLSIGGTVSFDNQWTGATNNNWNTASNWSGAHVPNNTENVLISSGSPILNTNYEIPTGYNLTISGSGTLIINPGNKLTVTGNADFGGKSVSVASDATGSGAIVLNGGTLSNASNVTLQQWMTAQRAWRVLSNPFSTALSSSAISTSNSLISVNQNGVNDFSQYNVSSDSWSSGSSFSANTPYAFFYKGLQSDFTGNVGGLNNYSGAGPSATAFSVMGTLNTTGVSITPTTSSGASIKYTLVGNPFAAPVNSQALTGNTSLPYYYYSANSGSTDIKVKSGAWLAASTNSSTTTTIPMMGVIGYESPTNTPFTIATSAINTIGTLNTSLFKTTSGVKNLEINLVRNSNLHDRLIIREDDAAISNSVDAMDLNKMENPISNLYSITPNNQHLAVNTEYQFTQAIPLGINAPIGQYEFKVGANSFSNTDMVLIDHYLNQQQVLHNGASYNFEVTADSNTKGEHRFEIAKQAWATNIATSTTMEGLQILNIVVVDQITLFAAPQKQAMHYMLLDINAALIDKGNLIPGENHISTQTLAQGLYLLHVTSENAHIVYKIIKQ